MRHHFVLTLQWPTGAVADQRTLHGTTGVPPGMTRDDVLKGLIERMRDGRPATPVVLFFSLEPNEFS